MSKRSTRCYIESNGFFSLKSTESESRSILRHKTVYIQRRVCSNRKRTGASKPILKSINPQMFGCTAYLLDKVPNRRRIGELVGIGRVDEIVMSGLEVDRPFISN
ncbi:hypothetical protein TNCT_258511 [Trichonephila clavata]|uniref:Uncharacterized protein n=1 Tax=Trichonephila clavata TaxID=2740835 RepID=A0A8X6M4W9_TRICU|nr:hypothetical protein TNCT_258511 [Trichonephila clavata]